MLRLGLLWLLIAGLVTAFLAGAAAQVPAAQGAAPLSPTKVMRPKARAINAADEARASPAGYQLRPRTRASIVKTSAWRATQSSRLVSSLPPVRPQSRELTHVLLRRYRIAVADRTQRDDARSRNRRLGARATYENAIDLRRINLIGIVTHGTERAALVRLANGKVVAVGVGDRVDGGRITAIGDARMVYVKEGTNHVLKMPQG